MVQAHHLDTGDLLNHRLHERPRRLDQMGPHLFEQVPPLLGRERLDQMLFGRGQDALEADHEKIIDQVCVDVFGPPAHVLLLEATDPFTDGGFDFPLRFHGDLGRVFQFPVESPHGRSQVRRDRTLGPCLPGSPGYMMPGPKEECSCLPRCELY